MFKGLAPISSLKVMIFPSSIFFATNKWDLYKQNFVKIYFFFVWVSGCLPPLIILNLYQVVYFDQAAIAWIRKSLRRDGFYTVLYSS